MKILIAVLLFLVVAATTFAQPDPRDSVIIESKTVEPVWGTGGAVRLKVYITNKDSLTALDLVLREVEVVGFGLGSMNLSHPRTFGGIVEPLTNTLRHNPSDDLSGFPGPFKLAAGANPGDASTVEPPNAVRKAVWEIKYDTIYVNSGNPGSVTVAYDSATLGTTTHFTNAAAVKLPVHFLAGLVTISIANYDMDLDGAVSAADVVRMLQCVFLEVSPPAGAGACDLNCDGKATPADAMIEILAVFNGRPFPC